MHTPYFVAHGIAKLCERLKPPVSRALRELGLGFAALFLFLTAAGTGFLELLSVVPAAAASVAKYLWNRDDLFALLALAGCYACGAFFSIPATIMIGTVATPALTAARGSKFFFADRGAQIALQVTAALAIGWIGFTVLLIKSNDAQREPVLV